MGRGLGSPLLSTTEQLLFIAESYANRLLVSELSEPGVARSSPKVFIAESNVEFIFDYFQKVVGLFGGGLAGIFILTIIFSKANASGARSGLFGSALLIWIVRTQTVVTGYLYGAIGVASCDLIG